MENKFENIVSKLDDVDVSINRISNNIERLIFWIKNPHKFLYRKILSKISNYLRLKDKIANFQRESPSDKFHVVVLTPDVEIDRRTMQMCETIIKNYNAKCTIIAALEGKDKIQHKDISIKRVNPKDSVNNIGNLWFPEDIDINLTEFYWLHNQYLSKALSENANLYIACDLPVLPAAVIAAKTKNIPLIYDAHELYPEQAVFDKEKKELLTKVEKTFIKYADVVITVNESIANEMAKRYSINKPSVILNALNPPENFDIGKKYNHFRKNLPISENQKILLFQGGFSPYRNLENLVRSGKYLKENIVIVLMGFGDYEKELKNIAKSEGLLDKKVFFHPAVPQDVLLEYSASADVGIIPYPHVDLNSYYCTPNKLFEFIQAGIPILANESPELKRFVEGYNIGIVYKLDTAQDIAKGINRIFSKDLDKFRENILKIRSRISWEYEEKKFLKFLKTFFICLGTED